MNIDELKKLKTAYKTAYEKYKLQWMLSHGHSINDICKLADEWKNNPDQDHEFFESYLEEYGFMDEIWACFAEFLVFPQILWASSLKEFTKEETLFRLTDTFDIENPSDELVNELAEHLCETTESWIDSEKIEELIQDILIEKGLFKSDPTEE